MRNHPPFLLAPLLLAWRRSCLSRHPPKALPSTSIPVTRATVPVTQATPTIRLIPATMGTVIRVTVTPIQAMAMAMAAATALHITALIGAIIDALRAEFIGDGTAGIRLV